MFDPDDDPNYEELIRAYYSDPERWHVYHEQARVLVGYAIGHVVVGTAEDIRQAKRAVGRAIQLYMAAGLTQKQAADQVVSLAQLFGSLE